MGVHICLTNGNDHPDWDFLREQNDKYFTSLIDFDDVEYFSDDDYDSNWFRPKDTNSIRAKIKATDWENKDRYLYLMDLIDKYTDYWLYFSW